MKFDEAAAAYGLVQVVFADVTGRLVWAVAELQRQKDPTVTFEKVYKKQFKNILDAFKDELKALSGRSAGMSDDLLALQDSAGELAALATWRNDRIHARVVMSAHGLSLYDWRTGKPLSISQAECVDKIERLTRVLVTLEQYLPSILGHLDMEKDLAAMFEGINLAL